MTKTEEKWLAVLLTRIKDFACFPSSPDDNRRDQYIDILDAICKLMSSCKLSPPEEWALSISDDENKLAKMKICRVYPSGHWLEDCFYNVPADLSLTILETLKKAAEKDDDNELEV